jgi:2-oxoglutarate ferredoxin oxidoreductase subunit beta
MAERAEELHPNEYLLQPGSLPSICCPGCGIGTVVNTFIQAVGGSEIDPNTICVVSGIGCTGKIAEYLNLKSLITTDGRVFNCAVNIKLEHEDLQVVVFSNNADFLASGAKDFSEIGGKGVDILMIHINNIIYTVTEHGVLPSTPFVRISFDQNFVLPFNIPHLAKSYGAQYVARWTPLRAGWLMHSIINSFSKKGFSVIEVISPCLMYYVGDDRIGDAVERMEFYDRHSVMKHGECTENLDIRADDKLIIGRFVDE